MKLIDSISEHPKLSEHNWQLVIRAEKGFNNVYLENEDAETQVEAGAGTLEEKLEEIYRYLKSMEGTKHD